MKKPILAALCVGGAYYALAALALFTTQGTNGIATIWPASGILVAALLISPRENRLLTIAAVATGSFLVNFQFGSNAYYSAMFTLANLVEGIIVVAVATKGTGKIGHLDQRSDLTWSFFGAVVGSTVGATLAAILTWNLSLTFFLSWMATVCLGTLIVAPMVVTVTRQFVAKGAEVSQTGVRDFLLVCLAVFAVTTVAFAQTDYPLLFLPFIGVLAATYRFGTAGAAGSIFVITMLGGAANVLGTGPVHIVGRASLESVLFFQFYLFSLLVAAWPLASLLAQKQKWFDEITEHKQLLERAEKAAHVGHWFFDVATVQLKWSDEIYRIHDLTPDSFGLDGITGLATYHPEDRALVDATLQESLDQGTEFQYDARIVRPDGSIRFVTSKGEPTWDSDGNMTGLFGMLSDVTEQTETLEALKKARISAEREAVMSKRLSETDQLTDIANRRKILATLEMALTTSKTPETPLSIVMFDVDRFKQVNDAHGHHVGDEVLQRIANISRQVLRESDIVGRLGGEEFLIVLPGADSDQAVKIAERLRTAIADRRWGPKGPRQVTISLGLATHHHGDTVEEMMRAADKALYQAKNDGRNLLRLAA